MNCECDSKCISYLILVLLAVSLAVVGHNGRVDSYKIDEYINLLITLQANVTTANLAIRQAAMAPTEELILKEYSKTITTTMTATKIHETFLNSKFFNKEERTIVDELIQERPQYKYAQGKVKWLITTRTSKRILWEALKQYEYYQVRYQERIVKLLNYMKQRSHRLHIKVICELASILGFIAFLLILEKYLIFKGKIT